LPNYNKIIHDRIINVNIIGIVDNVPVSNKKTVQLNDYVQDSTDNYSMTAQRISDFQQTRREIKSDFDFVFDWPEYVYSAHDMPDSIKAVYEKYEALEAAKQEALEAEKAMEEKKARGEDPAVILSRLIPEGITFGNTREECEAIITKSGRKNYIGKTVIVLYEQPVGSYTADLVQLWFSGEGPADTLIRVVYPLYGNTKEAEAKKAYNNLLPIVQGMCGNPDITRKDQERPNYNDLKGDLVGLITGPAYKPSDFDGDIKDFAEWLKEDGESKFTVLLFNKFYKAHLYYQVDLYIEAVK